MIRAELVILTKTGASLSTLQKICRRVDDMGSAGTRRAGSGRTKSARTALKGLRRLGS